MQIIEEYINQQSWRNWRQYVEAIPIDKSDRVIDLGCSVGGVANVFAEQANWVTGIDSNGDFINYCSANRLPNQNFICGDFTELDYSALLPINGIWSSFSISYLQNPHDFLNRLYKILSPNGWIALLDVSCFISGNMLPQAKYYSLVRSFEMESHKSGVYDFDFGSKMESILTAIGFEIIHVNDNMPDEELNFDGVASDKILLNWSARLQRMQRLKNHLSDVYNEICEEIISSLQSENHSKRNNVRFVVAKKTVHEEVFYTNNT